MNLFKTNIRQKVLLGLAVFMVGTGIMAWLAYTSLVEVEKKVELVEIADDLTNIVLEIRRTEKNLLLYGEEANLAENRRFIDQALALLDDIAATLSQPVVERELGELEKDIQLYSDTIKQLTSGKRLDDRASGQLVEQLRESGKVLMEQSKAISRYERADILRINQRLRRNLLYSMGILLVVSLAAFLFITFKIVLPLRMIERATGRIAKGDFTPLEVRNTNDEIQRVMEALNRMADELDTRRDQLVQAQKLSSIGTLASGIAHQLNNPLNNISTSCQILVEEKGCDKKLEERMLANIEQETLRARDIVRGLLEFSRNEKFSLDRIPLDQVVSRAARLTSSQIPPGISLRTDVDPSLVVAIDFQRIQEALINLILNAVQAIDEPTGEVVVTGRTSADGASALLTVQDTGKGIPAELRERIFDPFFTTKDVGSGTGLGLYVVYGIIKQHHGRIWVEDAQGKGTAFHIDLPREQGA